MKRFLIALALVALVVVVAALLAPTVGRWYVDQRLLPELGQRLSRQVTAQQVTVELGQVELRGLTVRSTHDAEDAPMARIPRVLVRFDPWSVISGPVQVRSVLVDRLQVRLVRHPGGADNFGDLLRRGRRAGGEGSGAGGRVKLGRLRVLAGDLAVDDRKGHLSLGATSMHGSYRPGVTAELVLGQVRARVPGLPGELVFSRITATRAGRGQGWPTLGVQGGKVRLLPQLELTGIRGALKPEEGPGQRIRISLRGGYGGAQAELWQANGWIGPRLHRGDLRVTARRFRLGRVSSVLQRTPVIMPHQTMLDGALRLGLSEGLVTAQGTAQISKLNLFHPGLARTPVLDLSGQARARGQLDLRRRKLVLEQLTITSREVTVSVKGSLDGSKAKPVLALSFKVPKVPCQTLLKAFPASLVPNLKDFKVRGNFELDLSSRVDFADLDKLTLGGKVGINRCKVTAAPTWASAQRLTEQFEHQVEVTPGQFVAFIVGPDSDNYVPYEEISTMMVHAVLTTEDGGFFRHRGFITSQFRKALARNLKRGGFRLGASTISMQMVKNVLLTGEKTLSRKLQEMFITWYLEQNLTKERILEIYLNVVELGPGIYGVGAASQHYFGKPARDLTPLEAAFFATLLPSPKRRYVQYCHGKLLPKWDRYVRRVLRRMASRGYVSQVALAAAEGQQLVFKRDLEEQSEKECNKIIEDLVETWREEYGIRMRKAIISAAPDKLDLYLPPKK